MQIKLNPCKICGNIYAPASKSMLIRAFAASVLCKGKTIIRNFTLCDDVETAINIIKSLGAEIEIHSSEIQITGTFVNKITNLYCGESALCLRMFAPVAGFFSDDFEASGKNTLLNRNIGDLMQALNLLGMKCENKKYLPVRLKGKIKGGKIKIDANGTSQTLSGLLTILPLCSENSVIDVENLHSKPYIDLTVSILEKFGVKIINKNYKSFFIKGNQSYNACTLNIEGDWSGVSCLLAAAATGGNITVENLNPKSKQADVAMLDVLRLCGANVMIEKNKITVEKNRLNAFEFDATDCPDLFPAIVALAANCKGTSIVKGALRLQNKESNRAKILQSEFAGLGIKIELKEDIMYIFGNSIGSATVSAHNDHRIAMALAAASVNASGNIIIENAECVTKSYPDFWKDFSEITN
ncbi:MAG: 3-phosphoshikimate 1-carboxyvinyltransferase [Prevotellaceae bacterium]|jgi:3-phosphoshikimate 1-carboxyvinyltransferase|nr:3-phosphoshikimate 1-carboxyvinyltransferase [Prevotellaceae bacterium]